MLQIISQNYVVWNSVKSELSACAIAVANYITKLRGLKLKRGYNVVFFIELQIISQNYVVWNYCENASPSSFCSCCKLYHKTMWFETYLPLNSLFFLLYVANYITKLHGLKLLSLVLCHLYFDKVANYITKLRGLKQCVANIT